MPKVFLPYAELFQGKCIPASLKEIKTSFDGVECHLIGRLRSTGRIRKLREEAAELGLGIRFHQGWSWETGQRNLYNIILRFFGALVPVGTSLSEQVRDVGIDAVVIYGNLVNEPSRQNYVYQTASERVRGKAYAMTFDRFASVMKSRNLRVAFDTQHVLEWFLNKENVVGLPTDPKAIRQTMGRLWEDFHPFVEEIHLCDFDPRRGPFHGLNIFLGDGVFPLNDFCADVSATDWDGIVVPEVAPQHLRGNNKLRLLREKVDQFFR